MIKNYILIIIVSLCLISCAKSDVDIVKNGTLSYEKSITIGDAFDNFKFFKNKKWEAHEEENKRKCVVFMGELDLEKLKETKYYNHYLNNIAKAFIMAYFVIHRDKTININYFSYKIVRVGDNRLQGWNMDSIDYLIEAILNIYKNDSESGLKVSHELRNAYSTHFGSLKEEY